ncbi:MAG: sulfite exporter TauE/SafE family protein [Rhodobacteraceae bacterium]|nr:sulfite exporter TauE/SafE family protein [Paracoccaceae bacterium]
MDLTALDYTYILLAALIVGFSKTAIGSIGILAVVLMTIAIPGKDSPGVLLPMLIVADIFAVIYYRRDCRWDILIKLFPLTAVGIVIGYFSLKFIPAAFFPPAIGVIILVMLVVELGLTDGRNTKLGGALLTGFVGIFAGIATMVANAAGSIFEIYLLQMGLTKKDFVGTRSWYFLIVNIFKIPFSANLGLLTAESLKLNLMYIPVIFIGAFLGVKVVSYLNLNVFKWVIRVAVVVSAVRLIAF